MDQIRNRYTGEIMCDGKSLKEVVESHKEWLSDNTKGKRANLPNADLRGAGLPNADLSHANLSYANLSGADLSYVDLSDVNLRSADLYRTIFRSARVPVIPGLDDVIEYFGNDGQDKEQPYAITWGVKMATMLQTARAYAELQKGV